MDSSKVNTSGNCTYGDVRLVGGSNQYEGRVEVCINDQWGTVCSDFWTGPDTSVVCKQLGYSYTGSECHICLLCLELLPHVGINSDVMRRKLRKVKRPAAAGNQTQDTWLVQPVLCHRAMTTGQPPALTILYVDCFAS